MTQTDPKLAVAYLRCSTDRQDLSPDVQRHDIAGWARREGVTIAFEFADVGVSGASEMHERPGLLEALQALRRQRAGLLVVARRDRLARQVVVSATIDAAVRRTGARIVTADGVANDDDPSAETMRQILDVFAGHELRMIGARTKAALERKRANGERTGTLPFGYRLADDGVHLLPDQREHQVIERVRALRAAGHTYASVASILTAEGARSRNGRPFAVSALHAIATRVIRAA